MSSLWRDPAARSSVLKRNFKIEERPNTESNLFIEEPSNKLSRSTGIATGSEFESR
jgi:hypothetical protein